MHASNVRGRRGWALCAVACGLLAQPAFAEPATASRDTAGAAAVSACEHAATATLEPLSARLELVFAPAPLVAESLSNESATVLRGAGRWKAAAGPRTFTYNCTFDPSAAKVVGIVMRDTTRAVVKPEPPPPAEPDLKELSPEACESSAVAALRQRWPRVSNISFDTGTRTFSQQSGSHAELHGSGLALPAPGAPNTLFGFDCAIDPRDGRVLRTSISG